MKKFIFLILWLFFSFAASAYAADRYWVGGTANWDATAGTKWALTSGGAGGEAVPTSSDNVFFDAASGAVTVAATGNTLNLDFTGFTRILAGRSKKSGH